MSVLVMKFGGAAMSEEGRFSSLAELIEKRAKVFDHVVVVVSAMGNATDQLMQLAKKVHPHPPKREQDLLVTVGERVSMTLLAMALDLRNIPAVSFTGSQAGIITTSDHAGAEILRVHPFRISEALKQKKVVIVAGFQGVSEEKEVTTLGRGGSDTSAVALAVALGAERVEFYKDVPGIGKQNPKSCPSTKIFPELSYAEALSIVGAGAEVLHHRCLLLAERHSVCLQIHPYYDPDVVGTVLREKETIHV